MNNWITYVNRSYASIKTSVNNRLNNLVPELVDKSPSNLMQVIVDIFAGISEILNYYIDTSIRELFLPVARRFSSVIRLGQLAGYNGRAVLPASARLVVTVENSGEVIPNPQEFEIPAGEAFQDNLGNYWLAQGTNVFKVGYYQIGIDVSQYLPVSDFSIGTINAGGGGTLPNPEILLPSNYADNSGSIVIGVDDWERVDTLGFSSPTDKHFYVKIGADGRMYAIFGDGTYGQFPPLNTNVLLTYNSTAGATGNVGVDAIQGTSLIHPDGTSTIVVTNPSAAVGGKEIEDIQDIRKAIPISLRTLNRAVTKQDYEDITTLAPGVRAARVRHTCGTTIEIFAVGETGGNISPADLSTIQTYIENRSVLTLPISVKSSGESNVRGEIDIVGKYRAKEPIIKAQVDNALFELYNPKTTNINQPVRMSDIIATVDNVSLVDYLTLKYIYIEPYIRPTSNLTDLILYSMEVLPGSVGQVEWSLTWNGSVFDVRRAGFSVGTIGNETKSFGNGVVDEITINMGTLPSPTPGDTWQFTVYPYFSDVELNDMSIPVIEANDFVLNITETYIT